MTASSKFDYAFFLPQFDLFFLALFSENISMNNPQVLSTIFLTFMFSVLLIFLVVVVVRAVQASLTLRTLLRVTQRVALEESGRQKLEELKRITPKQKPKQRMLWEAFDESLIDFGSEGHVFRSVSASHFFNHKTLGRMLPDNRLLAAIPSFLTAMGVVGTFAGLVLGLAALEQNSDASVEVIRQGIGHMIAGASLAFKTSLYGVFFSLFASATAKFLERILIQKIYRLQERIDQLFPQHAAENVLLKLTHTNEESLNVLNGLAEQIGNHMQTAMVGATQSIQSNLEETLNNIMKPAIEALTDQTNDGSQRVMETLLNRFMERMGKEGDQQREALQRVSHETNQTIQHLGTQMDNFLQRMMQQIEESEQRSELQKKALETELSGAVKQVVRQSDGILNEVGGSVQTYLKSAFKAQEEQQKAFSRSVTEIRDAQEGILSLFNTLLEKQQRSDEKVNQRLLEVSKRLEEVSQGHQSVVEGLNQASDKIYRTSEHFEHFQSLLQQSSELLSSRITEAAEKTAEMALENQQALLIVQETLTELRSVEQALEKRTEQIQSATEYAEKGTKTLTAHFGQYQKSVDEQVHRLNEEVSRLLKNYAESVQSQTQERLNVWNEQTSEFIVQLKGAVETISSVVDEIEGKIFSPQNAPVTETIKTAAMQDERGPF
ncbi:anti-phage ZorAB system protein ZorA [Magnetococcales bacterium HHB-1]